MGKKEATVGEGEAVQSVGLGKERSAPSQNKQLDWWGACLAFTESENHIS